MLEALPETSAREAALKHSYPDWIAETWWRDLGESAALELMRAQNEPAEVAVRLVRGEIDGTPDPEIPGAWLVDRIDERALSEGRIWPQSRASQLVGLAVGAREGERTLDLCAAPGGKATMLAGEVVAVDVNEARARELEETARRLGASNVRVVVADGRSLPPELDGFDRALVDAPCSGLGVLNRRPDLRWRAEPLPELQLELLRAAAERVRPGGTIVYSVCTINADESEAVVDASGLEVDRHARGGMAAVPPSRDGPSSCRRCRTSTEPRASSSRGCGCDPRRLGSSPWTTSFIEHALELAERGRGTTHPNPIVGAVVVAGGEVVGEGWHEEKGGPHAEVAALADAGEKARGATVYVTLEPCAHHGETPPCVDALVEAGVARVVAGQTDPHPGARRRPRASARGRGRGRARRRRPRLPLPAADRGVADVGHREDGRS